MNKQLLPFVLIGAILVATTVVAPDLPSLKACGCGYSYPTYTQPSYVYVDRVVPVAYPVPFTVAVPVVSYLWNGGYGIPGYSPVFNAQPATGMGTVQVPQAPTVAQAPARVDRGAPATAAPQVSVFAKLTTADLDYLISRITQRLTEQAKENGNGQSPPNSPPPPVPQDNKPQGRTQFSDGDVLRVLTAKNGAQQKSCADCHTGATAQGGMRIFDSPGVYAQNVNWAKVWDAADAGRMPKEAQSNKNAVLSDEACDILRWKLGVANAVS